MTDGNKNWIGGLGRHPQERSRQDEIGQRRVRGRLLVYLPFWRRQRDKSGRVNRGGGSGLFLDGLEKAGYQPKRISTTAKVSLEQSAGGFRITTIDLETEAEVPGIEEANFQEQAEQTKKNCPVSVALSGTQINLKARLTGR